LLLLLEISVRLLTKMGHEQAHSTLPTSKTNGRHGKKVHFPHLSEPFPRISHASLYKNHASLRLKFFRRVVSAKGRAEYLGGAIRHLNRKSALPRGLRLRTNRARPIE
jgi:hypothetical protein